MKKTTASLFTAAVLSFLFISCKKTKDVNTAEVRLTAIETISAGQVSSIHIEYNNDRVSRISSSANNAAPVTMFTVSYNSNEAVLALPAISNGLSTVTDTTRFILDAAGRVIKKMRYSYNEFNANDPQRTFIYDTTVYEYDAIGLLKKETRSGWDSTWFNPASGLQIITVRTTGTVAYTNSNGNLASASEVSDRDFSTKQGSRAVTTARHTVVTTTYQYNKNYANKTDFTNAFIINELNAFAGAPLNSLYASLPDKFSTSILETDNNGAAIYSNTVQAENILTYNSYGFASGKTEATAPGTKTTYVYNK